MGFTSLPEIASGLLLFEGVDDQGEGLFICVVFWMVRQRSVEIEIIAGLHGDLFRAQQKIDLAFEHKKELVAHGGHVFPGGMGWQLDGERLHVFTAFNARQRLI